MEKPSLFVLFLGALFVAAVYWVVNVSDRILASVYR